MAKLKALLFDIDGTLVDSNDMHADCWVAAFANFGKRVDREAVRLQIGKGGDWIVPDALNAREMRAFGAKLKEYRGDLWKKEYMRKVRPFPGVEKALRKVHERGLRLAFASSSNPDEVEYYVELLGIGKLLEGSTSKGDAQFSKPSPEIFQAALEETGSKADETLVVGDTPYDILAAHGGCMAVAALRCGGFPEDMLTKAEFLFEDVAELVGNLETIDEYFASE